jgi:hypothetical protein
MARLPSTWSRPLLQLEVLDLFGELDFRATGHWPLDGNGGFAAAAIQCARPNPMTRRTLLTGDPGKNSLLAAVGVTGGGGPCSKA